MFLVCLGFTEPDVMAGEKDQPVEKTLSLFERVNSAPLLRSAAPRSILFPVQVAVVIYLVRPGKWKGPWRGCWRGCWGSKEAG